MRNITTLTTEEAESILEEVFPGKTPIGDPKNYQYYVEGLSFEPPKTPDGGQWVTSGGRSIVGIKYRDTEHGDGFLLCFDDTKVLPWLFRNGFNISEQLESNKYYSEMAQRYADAMFEISHIVLGEKSLFRPYRDGLNLDQIKQMLNKIVQESNKDY